MPWVARNDYLTLAEMQNNATLVYNQLTSYGFSLSAIAGILGNMQVESGINPGIWENLDPYNGGYGLVQWTPYTNYSDWAGSGWENNGDKQCERINYEFTNNIQYIATASYPETASQFKVSTQTPEYLASAFLYNYERPADPASSVALRQQNARSWYDYLTYVPRLTMGVIYTSPYYTTYDAYYWTYRMPNCTAYAYGRWNELARVTASHNNYPTGMGYQWYQQGINLGLQVGQVPQLGAAAVWYYLDSHGDPSGHVSIVEEIQYDSNGNPVSFTTSNSAYYRTDPDDPSSSEGTPVEASPYFYLDYIDMNNLNKYSGSTFLGFVYHPNITPSPPGPTPTSHRKMPFILYLKRPL